MCLLAAVLFISVGCGGGQKNTGRQIQFAPVEPGVVKAMTFNIRVDTFLDGFNRWNNRKERVIEMLASNEPDVIGLQEALDFQVEDVVRAMPQYMVYAVGRNDGVKGESCAIFYRKDRFKLVDSGTFWFSDTPQEPGSKDWGNLPPRICSWVYLVEKGTKKGFYAYNVHLDNMSQNSRRKSTQLLAKEIAARKMPSPFIVMGDFNMDLNNSAMRYLQNISGKSPYPKMIDSWQSVHGDKSGTGTGTRHSIIDGLSGPRIDHIPISENARALEVSIDQRQIDGRYPSDHFPVIAKILLDEKPAIAMAKGKKSLD